MPRPDETDEGQCQHRRAGTLLTAPETCAAGFELPGCPNGGATSCLPQNSRRSARMCQQETLPIEIRRTRGCLSATEYRSWPREDLRQLIDESEISFRRAEMR